MSSEKTHNRATRQLAPPSRAAIGVHSATGWIDTSGGCIAFEDLPDSADPNRPGQAVVCLHDAGSGSREFRPLLDRLPSGIHLICVDWPGHGRSGDAVSDFTVQHCAETLETVLDHLKLTLSDSNQTGSSQPNSNLPVLLGSGFGAAVALHFAAANPAGILGVVLCQPAGLFPETSGTRLRAPSLCRSGPKGSLSNQENAAQRQARRQALRIEALEAAMRPLLSSSAASLSPEGLRRALTSLQCPALFALSRDSKTYPLKQYLALLDPLLARSPQHRFTVFSGGFHPVWDEPERFAQALNGFVQGQLPLDRHRHAWLLTAVDWPTRDMNLWKCVHAECPEEQILAAGQNANALGDS